MGEYFSKNSLYTNSLLLVGSILNKCKYHPNLLLFVSLLESVGTGNLFSQSIEQWKDSIRLFIGYCRKSVQFKNAFN